MKSLKQLLHPETKQPYDPVDPALSNAYYDALGGDENIKAVEYCATRVRLHLNDVDSVDDVNLKSLGAIGVVRPGGDALHVIIGPEVTAIGEDLIARFNEVKK